MVSQATSLPDDLSQSALNLDLVHGSPIPGSFAISLVSFSDCKSASWSGRMPITHATHAASTTEVKRNNAIAVELAINLAFGIGFKC